MKFRAFSIIVFFLLSNLHSHAQAPELSADEPINFQADSGVLSAVGNAVYNDGNTRVEADLIRFYRNENRLEAEGNVRVTRQGLRLLSESIRYNVKKRTFSSGAFRAGYPPLYISGESFSGSLDEIDFSKVTIFFREPVQNSPQITLQTGTWVSEERLTGEGLNLQLPLGLGIPLPPLNYEFGTPALTAGAEAGYRNNLGAYVRSYFLYPFTNYLDAGTNFDLYSERGVLFGPIANLTHRTNTYDAHFRLNSGFIRDHSSSERGNDLLGNEIGRDRYFLDLDAQVHSKDATHQLNASYTRLHDSEVYRDFRPDLYFPEFQPDNFFDYTYQQNRLLLNVFTRAKINDYYGLVERMPEIRMEWLPGYLGSTGATVQGSLQFTRYRLFETIGNTGSVFFPQNPLELSDFVFFGNARPTELASSDYYNRTDATLLFTRPTALIKGLTVTPRIGARRLSYDQSGDAQSRFSDDRIIGELGLDSEFRFTGNWDVNIDRWDLHGLRHVSNLLAQYRYYPTDEENLSQYPKFDRFLYRPEKPVINLTDSRYIDVLNYSQVVRVGWENLFQTKRSNGQIQTLARLNLYHDYILEGTSTSDVADALYIESAFNPFPWLEIEWLQKFTTDSFNAESTFVRTRISSSDLWSASLLAEYLDGAIDQYALDASYRLTENFSVFGYWQYDKQIDAWSEQKYGLSRRFANSWVVQFYVSFNDKNVRESDFSVGLRVKWLSF